jgi:tRNA (guanine-N7-)-methyltransferase
VTLPPGIRTFKPRRSRITPRAQAALAARPAALVPVSDVPMDLAAEFGRPVVLEIGFGSADATARMAAAEPDVGILAVDIHTPGVGDLLDSIARDDLANVRVIEGDAIVVLERMIPPHSLAGVRSFFPDPWPKARHHKRRLVQPAVLDLVASRLVPGGWWHLATDWADYATAMASAFAERPGWSGGVVERPEARPVTRYERRALRDGRAIVDLRYVHA